LVAGGVFTRVGFGLGDKRAPGQFKVFTKVSHRLLKNWIGPAISALVGGAGIIARAIQAHSQIGSAAMA